MTAFLVQIDVEGTSQPERVIDSADCSAAQIASHLIREDPKRTAVWVDDGYGDSAVYTRNPAGHILASS